MTDDGKKSIVSQMKTMGIAGMWIINMVLIKDEQGLRIRAQKKSKHILGISGWWMAVCCNRNYKEKDDRNKEGRRVWAQQRTQVR